MTTKPKRARMPRRVWVSTLPSCLPVGSTTYTKPSDKAIEIHGWREYRIVPLKKGRKRG